MSLKKSKKAKTTKTSSKKDTSMDLTRGMTTGMQPHNILAATLKGQQSISDFLSPLMSTEMPSFGSNKRSVAGSSRAETKKNSSKKYGRRYDSDSSSCTESSESCSDSSSSSNDCDEPCCPNPFSDVTKLMENRNVDSTVIPFGFDALRLGIVTEALMPFIPSFVCDDTQVLLAPNTASGFDMADLQNAIGTSNASFCATGQALILADLPGTYADFNGLYLIACPPALDSTGYLLHRINWRDDDCGSMEVGEWIEILLGATAGVYEIEAIEESTQRINLTFLYIAYIQCASLNHMTVPGRAYCYYDELAVEEQSESSCSDQESCTDSDSESCSSSSGW